jgi:HPt (histidine-containing phosphotransfer) domain-containing protein
VIFGLSATEPLVLLILVFTDNLTRRSIWNRDLPVIRGKTRYFSGAESMKEEKHCVLTANQQTMQAQMDSQIKPFQGLASDSFDPVSLWERVNGDMELLRDLVGLFALEYPELLLNIKSAIEREAFADVQRFSHKLKGSALQFSGKLVVAAAGKLEEMGRTESLDGASQVLTTLQYEVLRLMEALKRMVSSERPVM